MNETETFMKRKALLAAILLLSLMTSCAKALPSSETVEKSLTDTKASSEITTAEETVSKKPISETADADTHSADDDEEYELYFFGSDLQSTPELADRFIKIYNDIAASEQVYPIEADTFADYRISAKNKNGDRLTLEKRSGRYESYIVLDGNSYYPPNEALDAFVQKSGGNNESIPDRMFAVTYECPEPVTNDDYVNAARECVFKWLDTLKTVDDPQYKISSYTPNYARAVYGTFIAAGMISGAKEFAVNVLFDVEGTGEGSVFRSYDSGYNTFYHYYDGPCVVARCRWEDGVCRIVQYDGAFMASVSEGLYGINLSEGGYATFFDFLRDKETVNRYKTADMEIAEEVLISHNPFMISDGKIFFADIDLPYKRELTELGNGKVSGEFGDSFYSAEGQGVYSSPARYNNDLREPYTLTFSRQFDLVFDDYNHDGNPDYTLKYDEDENGSYYMMECIANDGSPRAGGGDVYVAGRFEDSIRLQCTEKGYITFDTDENGNIKPSEEVDNYRMYSERYYFPAAFRGYSKDETKVHCFFWNNTSSAVSVGGKYVIERKSGDGWISAGSGNIKNTTCEPYREAQLEFDVSSLSEKISGEYRIALTVNGEKVCGGFYVNGDNRPELEITSEIEKAPSCVKSISFKIKNNGGAAQRISSARLIRNGGEPVSIDVSKIGIISAEREAAIEITAEDIGLSEFETGEYSLEVICAGESFSGVKTELVNIPDKSSLYFFGGKGTAAINDGKITLTVKNSIWTEETAEFTDAGCIEVFRDGGWRSTCFTSEELYNFYDYYNYYDESAGSAVTAAFGEEKEIVFADSVQKALSDEEYVSYLREYFGSLKAELDENLDKYLEEEYITREDYDKLTHMSIEEFAYYLMGSESVDIAPNELCRVRIGNEYVYFKTDNAGKSLLALSVLSK